MALATDIVASIPRGLCHSEAGGRRTFPVRRGGRSFATLRMTKSLAYAGRAAGNDAAGGAFANAGAGGRSQRPADDRSAAADREPTAVGDRPRRLVPGEVGAAPSAGIAALARGRRPAVRLGGRAARHPLGAVAAKPSGHAGADAGHSGPCAQRAGPRPALTRGAVLPPAAYPAR